MLDILITKIAEKIEQTNTSRLYNTLDEIRAIINRDDLAFYTDLPECIKASMKEWEANKLNNKQLKLENEKLVLENINLENNIKFLYANYKKPVKEEEE